MATIPMVVDDSVRKRLCYDVANKIERLSAELHIQKVANSRLQTQSNIFEDNCQILSAENERLRELLHTDGWTDVGIDGTKIDSAAGKQG